MTEFAEMLTPSVNFAVVQMPGRRLPGVVVQGDSLRALVSQVALMKELVEKGDLQELADQLVLIEDRWGSALNFLRGVCSERGIPPP